MSGEKTEQPTDKKLRDAKRKGNFPVSQDVAGVLVLACLCIGLMLGLGVIHAKLAQLSSLIHRAIAAPRRDVPALFDAAVDTLAAIVLPILGLACVLGVAGMALQVGLSMSAERIAFSLEKIDPVAGLKNLFQLRKLFDLAKSLLAIVLIGGAVVLLLRQHVNDLAHLPQSGLGGVLIVAGAMFRKLIAFVLPLFLAIAAVDYLFKRHVWLKDLKMTKDEVKRERISQDGNPLFKSRRMSTAREMQQADNLDNFANATMVLHDDAGQLVAIYYDAAQAPLPMVLCKAQGSTAAELLAKATATGMRVQHDDALTRLLYLRCQLNDFIPEEAASSLGSLLAK